MASKVLFMIIGETQKLHHFISTIHTAFESLEEVEFINNFDLIPVGNDFPIFIRYCENIKTFLSNELFWEKLSRMAKRSGLTTATLNIF